MKIIIAIFFSFVISTYSNELSLEQFKKIIKIKQDKVELVKGLKVLPFGRKTKSTFKYKLAVFGCADLWSETCR